MVRIAAETACGNSRPFDVPRCPKFYGNGNRRLRQGEEIELVSGRYHAVRGHQAADAQPLSRSGHRAGPEILAQRGPAGRSAKGGAIDEPRDAAGLDGERSTQIRLGGFPNCRIGQSSTARHDSAFWARAILFHRSVRGPDRRPPRCEDTKQTSLENGTEEQYHPVSGRSRRGVWEDLSAKCRQGP